jgi:hypothetical protein
MFSRSLVFFVCISTAACAQLPTSSEPAVRFDSGDEGIYGLLSVDGKLTAIRYRLTHEADRWRLEELLGPSRWQDVTCEKECRLVDSNRSDAARFTALTNGTTMNSTCMNNHAFAICKLLGANGSRFYLWVALITHKPIRLFLRRMPNAGADGAS